MIKAEQIERQNIVMVDLGAIPHPTHNENLGHEQAGIRPCLILKSIDVSELVVIVPLTTTNRSYLYSVVEIPQGTANLPELSFALCHQIRTVSHDRIQKFVGVLPDEYFDKILEVLTDFLEL